ncbi:MAG: hypothetical protein ACRDD1_13515, partial [Planctomycetia bacterium]
ISGGSGDDVLVGGRGDDQLEGNDGEDKLFGRLGMNSYNGGAGKDKIYSVNNLENPVKMDDGDQIINQLPQTVQNLLAAEVEQLLDRAAAATDSEDAIIAIVDRSGRILGVRVEDGVSPILTTDPEKLTFAVDGALAKARTAAFFANGGAPLTSRTIQFISQSTITQREVEGDPSITNPDSVNRGPGFVAPIGTGGHFPPRISFTPQVDLFAIEHTNRDSTFHPGADRIKGTADDVQLAERFNVDPQFIPDSIPDANKLVAPDSYGFVSGTSPNSQSRGIGTLPGGIPIYKFGQVVGGIGVFFPGKTGFANEENSALSSDFDETKLDRSYESEYIAYAAVNGTSGVVNPGPVDGVDLRIGNLGGVAPVPGIDLPNGRVDLVGITLDVFGPGGFKGLERLVEFGRNFEQGDPNNGTNLPIRADGSVSADGVSVPEGWLVEPHDGEGITRRDVMRIISQGVEQA